MTQGVATAGGRPQAGIDVLLWKGRWIHRITLHSLALDVMGSLAKLYCATFGFALGSYLQWTGQDSWAKTITNTTSQPANPLTRRILQAYSFAGAVLSVKWRDIDGVKDERRSPW